jgi:TonB family protein
VSTAVASRIREHFESRIEELEEEAYSEISSAVQMLNAGSSKEEEAELKTRLESYIEGASPRHKIEIEQEWQDRVAAIERERTDIERIEASYEDLRSDIAGLPALPSSRELMHLESKIADFLAEAPPEFQTEIKDLWATETNRIESTRNIKEEAIRNRIGEFTAKLAELEREVEAIERKRGDLQQEELDAGVLIDAIKTDWARERLGLWKSYQDWFVEFADSLPLRKSIRQIEKGLIDGDFAMAEQNVDEARKALREIDEGIRYGLLSRYQLPLVSYSLDRYRSDSGKTLQWTKDKEPGAVSAVIALYRDSVSELEDKGITERLLILETGQTAAESAQMQAAKGIEPAPESHLGNGEPETMVASNGTTAGATPDYVAAGAPSDGSVALRADDSSRPLDPQTEAAKTPPAVIPGVVETPRQGQGDALSPSSDESVKGAQPSPLTRLPDEQVERTEPPADKVYSVRELDRMIRPTRTSQPLLPFSRRRLPAAPGKVTVKFIVDEKGVPIEVSVVTSTDPKLDKPVLNAARKFRFEKPTKDGKPVKTSFHLPFNFGAK